MRKQINVVDDRQPAYARSCAYISCELIIMRQLYVWGGVTLKVKKTAHFTVSKDV